MGRRPERDPSPSTHRCERAAYRRARTPAESSHFLPGIFLQSGRNLRETFMQAMCLRAPNTLVEKMTRECQVGTQIRVHLRVAERARQTDTPGTGNPRMPARESVRSCRSGPRVRRRRVHCTTSASNRNVFSCLLSIRSATLCCVELDGSTPLDLWWLRNITNWRNHS
jgi:hypothetical protein